MVEKTLQREGKTSVNLDQLAAKLGFKTTDDLFSVVGKEEFSLRLVEQALHDAPPPEPVVEVPEQFEKRSSGASVARGASTGVLVVGVDALLTQLARCCRPAPPDDISGFVTRGKGMSIHRSDCPTFLRMAERAPERVLQTAWSADVMSGRGNRFIQSIFRSTRRTARVYCAISPKCSREKNECDRCEDSNPPQCRVHAIHRRGVECRANSARLHAARRSDGCRAGVAQRLTQ